MRALVVYNTFSGRSDVSKRIDYISERLKTKYELVECFASCGVNSIKEYIINYAADFDLLVAVGGDGTVNEAVNGLMQLQRRPIFAYIPSGTCNDTGKNLGLNKNIRKSVDIILEGEKVRMDVSKINEQYFIYGLAAGNLSDVSYAITHKAKKRFGRLAYYLNAIKSFVDDKTIDIKIKFDDCELKGKFFLFLATNSRYLASMRLRYKSRQYLNEGKLKITLIRKKNRFINTFDFIMYLLFGQIYKHNIEYYKTNKMVITSNKAITYNTDGEGVPSLSEIEVTVLPREIEMIVLKRIAKKYFIK